MEAYYQSQPCSSIMILKLYSGLLVDPDNGKVKVLSMQVSQVKVSSTLQVSSSTVASLGDQDSSSLMALSSTQDQALDPWDSTREELLANIKLREDPLANINLREDPLANINLSLEDQDSSSLMGLSSTQDQALDPWDSTREDPLANIKLREDPLANINLREDPLANINLSLEDQDSSSLMGLSSTQDQALDPWDSTREDPLAKINLVANRYTPRHLTTGMETHTQPRHSARNLKCPSQGVISIQNTRAHHRYSLYTAWCVIRNVGSKAGHRLV
jgi:predicted secreted protein